MKAGILPKSELSDFLSAVATKHPLMVPVEEDGLVDLRRYDREADLQLVAQISRPVKSIVLPQREEMFTFPPDLSQPISLKSEATRSKNRLVVFGVHPCDAKAIELLGLHFLYDPTNSYGDPYFRDRLESTIFIGWACNSPTSTCFCHAVGGGPHSRSGLDAIMMDLGDLVLVEAVTDEGKSIMDLYSLSAATDEAMSAAAELEKRVKSSMPKGLKLGRPMTQDAEKLFGLPLWEETAERCLNCGICTYICPTCSCFDILDHGEGEKGSRFRTWDSCMFSLFTLHASGYNPRSTSSKRLRQRFMHKLKYSPELHNARLSCVGCGRCVKYCPVNIDIREVAAGMIVR